MQPLKPNQLELLLAGNTLHLTQDGRDLAQIYFDPAGKVHAHLPTGKEDRGTWSKMGDDSYCIDWDNGPKRSCSQLVWQPGSIQIVDKDGKPRGQVGRITVGSDVVAAHP